MNQKVLVAVFVYNEGYKFRRMLKCFPNHRYYDVLIVDDGSTDGAPDCLKQYNFKIIRNIHNEGLGASIKKAFLYALENKYDIIVIMAGNGKDDPNEIERLLLPIISGGYDFVQGSRFLKEESYRNMPVHRFLATKFIHPFIFSILAGKKVTESTNGFRAFKTSILKDKFIDWKQKWLDGYELEQYLQFKVVHLGYKRIEVPVSKIYPSRERDYTKVKPFSGWWSMIKPLIYLSIGLKH